ncbi:c-type cytochrome [Methylocystis hirsuta]|uniref:Cytochrome c n=1 Tax=Methylocystis hirsuta TaxID=369798 RepID=A0A3M9XL43_9HYPH|nr:cytochrome c [Methylocystis hirsuta]
MIRAIAVIALCVLSACSDMSNQPKQRSYSPLVGPAQTPPGIVAFLYRKPNAPPLTLALIERGQQRYRIFCTPCHSELGNGQGMIVQRGFPAPPSYDSERLLQAPTRHFVDVIAQGHGAMYSYAARVPPADQWAIAAYIRALQKSQNASATDLAAAKAETAP